MKKPYIELLKDPRWQKKRLEILDRDDWSCRNCGDTESTLHVHHLYYIKENLPWNYESDALLTLCESCHDQETALRPAAESALLLALKRQGFTSCDLERLSESLDGSDFAKFEPLRELIVRSVMVVSDRIKSGSNWSDLHNSINKLSGEVNG